MNPKGEWVFRNFELQFLNEKIMALYGKVYPRLIDGKQHWYWEARTLLSSRIDNDICPSGYAPTEKQAKIIVETILKNTETVEF